MAGISIVRRTRLLHPANRTVGLAGGVAAAPYCYVERLSIHSLTIAPLRVALAGPEADADAAAAMALIERAAVEHVDAECQRVGLDAAGVVSEKRSDADCVVHFGQKLWIAPPGLDFGAGTLAMGGTKARRRQPIEVEIEPAARWHPVLEGIEPFMSNAAPARGIGLPDDATPLLYSRIAGRIETLAWARCRRGRVFCTSLGRAEDFRQAAFVRLVLNAMAWVGRKGGR